MDRKNGGRTAGYGRRTAAGGNRNRRQRQDRQAAGHDAPARISSAEGEDEAERRRRQRRARRARRERELRRQKRMLLAAGLAAAAVLIAGAIWSVNLVKSRRAETAAAAANETDTEDASPEGTDTEEAQDTSADQTGEAAQTNPDAPYVFVETEQTVSLGESLTDISIYDAQRNITTEETAEDSAEASSEGAGTAETEDAEGAAFGEAADSSSDASSEDAALASDYVDSQYVILVNATTGEILAERRAYERMVPASMTKVMTLLVAVEAMEDPEKSLSDTVTITQEICDEAYLSGSSFVGYGVGDTATVEDLLYGTILPSGADAAMALAEYTAGSQEAFAELMNQKAKELGISETTHFTNCVGLYDEEHYSTAYDMAVIMRAAADNDLCKKVLSAHTWTTGALKDNPEGTTLSNWFLRRIEDHDTNGTVLCGKTGFVNESGNCSVSYEVGDDGNDYIACTALTYNLWRCIYDHVALYKEYT